jgi:hypothetical protein
MRILVLTFLFVLLNLSMALGQGKDKLTSLRLREVLNVPINTSIELSESQALPNLTPLKVYIAVGNDLKVRDNFIAWINEWNKEESSRYGLIDIVQELKQADVALVRFIVPRVEIVNKTESAGIPATSEIDPATRQRVYTPTLPQDYYTSMPVLSYIIMREANQLKIIWSHSDESVEKTAQLSGRTDESHIRVIEMSTKEAMEGRRDSKGKKDSKKAGDKLRDNFFKLMKARSVAQK